ncbi:MAG: ribosomal RNA small subunit methyltransferase A [Planctomycetia bacterium]|nr:ribosomal RNA small subunit methyltransferase A [Planctomycetia bacterium]
MTATSSHQTQSFLMRRFAEVGIEPNTKRGQNFLVDQNLLRLLVDAARLDARDVVLEVGTGTGALTAMMAPLAAAVVSVEIDRRLHQLASEELFDAPNVTLLQHDALKNKNHLAPGLLDAVGEQLAAGPERRLKLVANLPYNVATPILSNLLAGELVPASMTVTIQKELADRIMARPSTKDYGALSLWVQSQCTVELVRVMPPTVFWPRPKVHSAILHIVVRDELRERVPDLAFFHSFIRAMFFHRRKFLRSELASAFKGKLDKGDADALMRETGLAPTARAEELDVDTMLRLCEAVRVRVAETC